MKNISFTGDSDGSIDRIQTAQQLVLNANIDIRKWFNLACMHCLQESIQILWAEMEASGRTENFEARFGSMVPFWVGRMGCLGHRLL
ncbi:hypothetical protein AVEN_121047-1 [Araneus ventricosus]|uniref:Uncharacterized protein n=1 Tax=Araneus ventricosus TaxID=182803 RepID=A0A4Y2F242_ARAVE|nr:hypothetical protein AVEN_121047-1 [Araneus ventricosus]